MKFSFILFVQHEPTAYCFEWEKKREGRDVE